MKKLAFFILLSLVTLGVSAQSNLKWNVNAGIGMSNWYGDDTDGTDAKFAYKVGIGLEVPFANTNIWSFQTGLNFISKGVKGDGVTDAWDVVDVTINQLYLELPLMVGALGYIRPAILIFFSKVVRIWLMELAEKLK